MDQITIDVSEIPETKVGDTVTIIGEESGCFQSADQVAEQIGTISYEVLSSLLPRVPRLYVRGREVVGVMGLRSDE
jgi:alanine racemase